MYSPLSDCHCQFSLICSLFIAVFQLNPSSLSLSFFPSLPCLSLSLSLVKKKHFITASALIIIQFNHLTPHSPCCCLCLSLSPPHSLSLCFSLCPAHSSPICLSWVLIKNVFPASPLNTAGSLTHCETGHFKLCSPFWDSVLKRFNSTTQCQAFLLMLKSCSLSSACLFKWATWEIHHTFFKFPEMGKTKDTIQLMKPILQISQPIFWEDWCSLVSFQPVINLVFLLEAAASKNYLKIKGNIVSVVIFMTYVIVCLEAMLIRSVIWLWRGSTILLLFFNEMWTVEWWNVKFHYLCSV